MKKAISMILLLAVICMVSSAPAETGLDWEEDYAEEPDPRYSIEGDTLILAEGVSVLGFLMSWSEPEEEEDNDPLVFSGEFDHSFRKIRWPSTIRTLRTESFVHLGFEKLTLPASLEKVEEGSFVYCGFDTLQIECVRPWDEIQACLDDCVIDAYEVPEGHPLYKAVNGVLYTKDGKTLLAYPNGRQNEHFDVPAGVKCIGRRAFEDEELKTVSLPIGLEILEDGAFYRCPRLQSIALPLTVSHVGKGVFEYCVSLDMVSLPAGIQVDKTEDEDNVIYYAEDHLFHGDNGDTGFDRGGTEEEEKDGEAWYTPAYREEKGVIGESGPAWLADTETVTVYDSSKDGRRVSGLPGGTPVYVREMKDFRCNIEDICTAEEIGWVDMDQLHLFNNESLFYYDDYGVRPPKDIRDQTGSTTIYSWGYHIFKGPYVWFPDIKQLIPMTETELYCMIGNPKGMGIVTDRDPLAEIFLLADPEGTEIENLHVGTQIRVLEEKGSWVRVTTGFEEGWLKKEQTRIVLPVTDMKEE